MLLPQLQHRVFMPGEIACSTDAMMPNQMRHQGFMPGDAACSTTISAYEKGLAQQQDTMLINQMPHRSLMPTGTACSISVSTCEEGPAQQQAADGDSKASIYILFSQLIKAGAKQVDSAGGDLNMDGQLGHEGHASVQRVRSKLLAPNALLRSLPCLEGGHRSEQQYHSPSGVGHTPRVARVSGWKKDAAPFRAKGCIPATELSGHHEFAMGSHPQ